MFAFVFMYKSSTPAAIRFVDESNADGGPEEPAGKPAIAHFSIFPFVNEQAE